jgi:hypothetical protein
VELRFSVTNLTSQGMRVHPYTLLGKSAEDLREITLTDDSSREPHRPLIMDGACVCSIWTYHNSISPGSSLTLWATFQEVPTDAKRADIDLWALGRLNDVPIVEGS